MNHHDFEKIDNEEKVLFSFYLQIEDPYESGSFDSYTCSIDWNDDPSYNNAIIKSYKGSKSLRSADDDNTRRHWDLIATRDEIIENTHVWKRVKG